MHAHLFLRERGGGRQGAKILFALCQYLVYDGSEIWQAFLPKKITLRAFRIENSCVTESHSDILGLLRQVLTEESTAAQRRMTLNAESPDRDLLADFTWAKSNVYLFGFASYLPMQAELWTSSYLASTQ